MHVLFAIVLFFGALVVIVLGLASVMRDLAERDLYAAPAIDKDAITWQHRGDPAAGGATAQEPGDPHRSPEQS
jgi:hypothetical protein